MIKYLNFGGFIEVSNKNHAYCVQTYIQIKEGETNNYYFSIINPRRRGKGFKEEGFPSKYIEELKSPHINNKNEKKKIQIINENYTKTGHMILKDEILLEWFFILTLSENMFGAKEIFFKIKEEEVINIKAYLDSIICIDICSNDLDIKPVEIYKYVQFNLSKKKLENDNCNNNSNNYEKIEILAEKKTFKIYENLKEGDYHLTFKILSGNKEKYKCRIRYFDNIYISGI